MLRFNDTATPAPDTDDAEAFVIAIAAGDVEVPEIEKKLTQWFG